jgi:hypothetical protein
MTKWDGEKARDRIADRLIKHGDPRSTSDVRPSSEKAFERAKEIAQRRDRQIKEGK